MIFVLNPKISEKDILGHIDRNRWNNNMNNLEW
jgi:hypothetical protein